MFDLIRALLGKHFCPWCRHPPKEPTWWERHFIEGRIGRNKAWRWWDDKVLLKITMSTGHPLHCRFHVPQIPRATVGQQVLYHDEGPYRVVAVNGDEITLETGATVSFLNCCDPC